MVARWSLKSSRIIAGVFDKLLLLHVSFSFFGYFFWSLDFCVTEAVALWRPISHPEAHFKTSNLIMLQLLYTFVSSNTPWSGVTIVEIEDLTSKNGVDLDWWICLLSKMNFGCLHNFNQNHQHWTIFNGKNSNLMSGWTNFVWLSIVEGVVFCLNIVLRS